MPVPMKTNDISKLYTLNQGSPSQDSLAGPALHHLVEAWQAIDLMEQSLPDGPDRWQADGIHAAREGVRRAWLAVSNLDRGLKGKT